MVVTVGVDRDSPDRAGSKLKIETVKLFLMAMRMVCNPSPIA